MQELGGVIIFTKVVEAGGFSKAADLLGMSKSAVSKQVTRLEDRLGARLLNRTTRRLSLTEAGAGFFERCQRIVADLEEAEQAVGELTEKPRGILKVTVPTTFATLHLGPLMAEFVALHSELSLELDLNDRQVDLIDDGFDAAVRIGELPDSSLIARKVAESKIVLCASPDYWAHHPKPVRPADIQNHECLRYSLLRTGDYWGFENNGEKETVKVSGRMRVNSGEMLRRAAVAGVGVVMSPEFIVGKDLCEGYLETALEDFMPPAVPIHVVYPPTRHLSPKVRAFVDFLAHRFEREIPWRTCPKT